MKAFNDTSLFVQSLHAEVLAVSVCFVSIIESTGIDNHLKWTKNKHALRPVTPGETHPLLLVACGCKLESGPLFLALP